VKGQAEQYMMLLYSYLRGEIELEELTHRSREFQASTDGDALVGIDLAFLNVFERDRMERLIERSGSQPPDAF
jgi:hypothetical protein